MSPRWNGADEQQSPFFNPIEAALNWHQQMLKAGLVSSEIMRIGMNHVRRQTEYMNIFSESLNALGKRQADFVHRLTTESASDWNQAADMAAGWTKDTIQTAANEQSRAAKSQ